MSIIDGRGIRTHDAFNNYWFKNTGNVSIKIYGYFDIRYRVPMQQNVICV